MMIDVQTCYNNYSVMYVHCYKFKIPKTDISYYKTFSLQQLVPCCTLLISIYFIGKLMALQLSSLGDRRFENPQTGNLSKIMKGCVLVKECLRDLNKPTTEGPDGQVNVQPEKRKKAFVCTILVSLLGCLKFC